MKLRTSNSLTRSPFNSLASKSGQVALVLVFVVVGLVFLFAMVADSFLGAKGKMRLENAGDAAALAAARWQGITLNTIGSLNMVHIAALCEGQTNVVDGIVALQERMAIVGPMMAMAAANAVARRNIEALHPMPADSRAYEEMAKMRSVVEGIAATVPEASTKHWETKGADYAQMLRTAVSDGAWAGCENATILPIAASAEFESQTQDGSMERAMLDRQLYTALAGDDSCGRFFCMHVFGGNHATAQSKLASWSGWGAPEITWHNDFDNAQFYGVGVQRVRMTLLDLLGDDAANIIVDEARRLNIAGITAATLEDSGAITNAVQEWYCYDEEMWREWWELDRNGAARFPLARDVKKEYNVKGATAACRVVGELTPITAVSTTNVFAWTCAAKPFGSMDGHSVLEVGDGEGKLVLPWFTMVRLIPLGGAGEATLGTADQDWVKHCREHVPNLAFVSGCKYCALLMAFTRERAAAAAEWLRNHHHTDEDGCCPPGVGPGPTGGTPHGR